MTSKAIARLAACKLKGHVMGYDGRCRQCFFDFWVKRRVGPEMTTEEAYDAMMEILDCK